MLHTMMSVCSYVGGMQISHDVLLVPRSKRARRLFYATHAVTKPILRRTTSSPK